MAFLPLCLTALFTIVSSLRYDPQFVDYNLNENQNAINPLDYWGEWQNHTFNPSPKNWRFPFYTLFLDRFANADPTNDNANGTLFEQDLLSTQLRHGGDILGVMDSLDYLQGMGIKALYIAGSPFINLPWQSDSYSPVDFTMLDPHFGSIENWRTVIDEIHRRGMYVVLDNTFATMSDLIGFQGYLNTTTPFTLDEHKVQWKSDRRYLDFSFSNDYNESCEYPRFWLETGEPVGKDVTDRLKGCYAGEFDQYGDTEAFGVFPDWQRQLSKFASVQDRLREWVPSVRAKIERFSCITVNMLDIDGFRFDKATQVTVDAQGEFSDTIRQCARKIGKENFFLPGEITGGNTFGSIYLGRGKQPEQYSKDMKSAVSLTNVTDPNHFIRDVGKNALDAAAFHYSIYRSLTRFLGMDGNLAAGYDTPLNWVDAWNTMVVSNDLINANTGVFDPRHMYGVTNQDVFRWPGIKNGTERMLLGMFITTLHMPGIPLVAWGEEQAFYILDNTANNYIYGRQPITSALAWQTHGCYTVDSAQYYHMPLDSALHGCHDDSVSLDHRDPAHPVRTILKAMYFMREAYPVLNDGYYLQQLSNQTRQVFYPGNNETATETGLWSVLRSVFSPAQDLSGTGKGNQSVWLVYHNDNATVDYQFDCNDAKKALLSAFDSGVTVKNLFYPYDELVLQDSSTKLGINGSTNPNGCVRNLTMRPYEFKAYVPKEEHLEPPPMIVEFFPGHDFRMLSKVAPGKQESVEIEFHFSQEMDCDNVTASLQFNSSTEDRSIPRLDKGSVNCTLIPASTPTYFVGTVPKRWTWKGTLDGVANGVHTITINNATSKNGSSTNAVDHFLLRIGQIDNPVVFPRIANYTRALLHEFPENKTLFISHKAAGADMWRYSLNWGSSWSDWATYNGGNNTLAPQNWTGTKNQKWSDEHVMVQYFTKSTGSSSVIQHADLGREDQPPRRFPHLSAHGPFNQYGFDAGLKNELELKGDGRWKFHFMSEWPDNFQLNQWGMNPDGQPDQSFIYGDVDNDTVLDRLPPSTLAKVMINVTGVPPAPFLAWQLSLDDGTLQYELVPVGNRWKQLTMFVLFWILPVVTATLGCWIFTQSFYGVKFNEVGIVAEKMSVIPLAMTRARERFRRIRKDKRQAMELVVRSHPGSTGDVLPGGHSSRRCVLIATMEYDIEDWNIKIKIGGLGVMAQLMGKNLQHQDLIWVVPCVGGVDYPVDQEADPMRVTILGSSYDIKVQYHILKNITYVLLDAPVFRKQTKAEPYPPRMDDLDSAVYYSAWNQCIAEAIKRFPVDLYHINDYHGAVAPLHLLPETIPACLSLHNAEFQGLWPMRTPKECKEVCEVFNLDPEVVAEYVQFGSVFNLLHAGASYLRVHQKGFGAVGVSKKYGKRSYARYPIFWGLTKVGQLPNPDPSDVADWDKRLPNDDEIKIDPEFEAGRAELKRQAQEWAHLDQDPEAELFVFVGRWSMQKGVDLIADIFPKVLEDHPKTQLICIGPVIDLYGKFAALKLGKMMDKYPGRVFSKPEFTALPPYIFSGAEFALIPSRDEPFGLVAVEFGRKGALGVGARVGGLGQMPGWWYTVESTTTTHLLQQFKMAIDSALACKTDVRAMMRARSALQRFPVAQWKEDLEILQTTSIRIHEKEAAKGSHTMRTPLALASPRASDPLLNSTPNSGTATPTVTAGGTDYPFPTVPHHGPSSSSGTATPRDSTSESALKRTLSLGVKSGPGHVSKKLEKRGRRKSRHNSRQISAESGFISASDYASSEDENVTSRFIDEYTLTEEELEHARRFGSGIALSSPASAIPPIDGYLTARQLTPRTSQPSSPGFSRFSASLQPPRPAFATNQDRNSVLSLDSVVGERTDFKLQKVDPFFTDSTGEFYEAFSKRLDHLDAKNSEKELCIEDYLVKSEKHWFDRFRDARLGRSGASTPAASVYRMARDRDSSAPSVETSKEMGMDYDDEFLLGKEYKPPTGLKKYLQMKIGDWPAYTFLLAFGQIISANSYQITLLTGEIGQSANKLYTIASIYLATSILWWMVFRRLKSIYVLSVPFLFYGLAFLFLGFAPMIKSESGTGWMQNVATAFYATASSSGSIFFALNFGDEGGSPVKDWVYRACIIQGTQQVYVVLLWYWGSKVTSSSAAGVTSQSAITSSSLMAAVTTPIAILMWVIGIVLFIGLPDFYRQAPGAVPSFYKSLLRRKIISWFFVAVVLQNYFLSAPYGRNWSYLWSSKHAPAYAVFLLVVLFFVVLWAAILFLFAKLSKSHSWILPIFAIGLGAPRWCQMLWGTSSYGLYLPWAGSPVAGALLGRSVWLWLGLLDTVQGVGFGMILLQTLTRIHVAFTLIAAQVLGSLATILARATAPNKVGPGDVFPDFSAGILEGLGHAWFWVALITQLIICVGFFMFFRKEQLSKP